MIMRSLGNLAEIAYVDSRSITAENPTGEKGMAGQASSILGKGRKGRPCINLPPETEVTIADIAGCGTINHIWCTVADSTPHGDFVLRDLVLRMYWDNSLKPSVEVPLGDFFCCGFGRKCRVEALPILVAPYGGFNCFFPLPFRKHARITVENQQKGEVPAFFYAVNYGLCQELSKDAGYFHALWNRSRTPKLGVDHEILSIKGSGHYVGTYLAWQALERYWFGEGEMKFFIDGDKDYPTICGTGVEDYVGGAWAFFEKDDKGVTSRYPTTFTSPYMGYPCHTTVSGSRDCFGYDGVPSHGLYRFHVQDPICFQKDLRVTVQNIGYDEEKLFERADDVSTVAYWYQTEPNQDLPALAPRDERRPR